MSKIALQITAVTDAARTIAALRSIEPDTSIAELRSHIASCAPVVEYVLYGNDFVDIAARLRALVTSVPATGATLRIFLLREEERLQDDDPSNREITVEVLDNMLASVEDYE